MTALSLWLWINRINNTVIHLRGKIFVKMCFIAFSLALKTKRSTSFWFIFAFITSGRVELVFHRGDKLWFEMRLCVHMHPHTHLLVRPLGIRGLQTLWCLGHCIRQTAWGLIDLSESMFSHTRTLYAVCHCHDQLISENIRPMPEQAPSIQRSLPV